MLLPLAVFLSVCARLSAEARARRLAALRLLGLSVKGTLRVNAVETVAAALLGALLGVGVYALANELLAQVGLPGLQWYPPDGRPSTTALAVCLLACPGLAWFVGRHRAREAALRPLQVRRGSQPRPRRSTACCCSCRGSAPSAAIALSEPSARIPPTGRPTRCSSPSASC
ncbi:FtsX-like permease family protein [Streptomyces sp. NPDC048445]|uniref:FtsX-like permease family protein n=1 Tax=Streptomyces sp. NPDC048445 TaxID=3365553 RepID=UPI00371D95E7